MIGTSEKVRECPECGGVVIGPSFEEPEDDQYWNCQSCSYRSAYAGGIEPHDEIQLSGMTEEELFKEARRRDYSGFIEWVNENDLSG